MRNDRLRQYALVGVRARVMELIEEVAELKQTLPSLLSLSTLLGTLSSVVDEIDDPGTPTTSKPNGVRPDGKPYKRGRGPDRKPRARKGNDRAVEAMKHNSALKSWLTGRDVLNVLAKHDGPITSDAVAKVLGVPHPAIWHRLRVRTRHGHVRLTDPATRSFELTGEGKRALERDRDTPL